MLFDDISRLRGVGPSRTAAFHKLGIRRMIDLVLHLPRRYEDRRILTPIGGLRYGQQVLISGQLKSLSSRRVRPRLSLHTAVLADKTGSIKVNFFNQDYLVGKAEPGQTWVVFGTCEKFGTERVFSMKEVDSRGTGKSIGLGTILPYYPATASTPQKYLRRTIQEFSRAAAIRNAGAPNHEGLPSFAEAVRQVHTPHRVDEIDEGRKRLALDELTMVRLCVERARRSRPPVARPAPLSRIALDLPFMLTTSQQAILTEIRTDLESPAPMRRLVEGDVGSGKTVLGILAAVHAAERGRKTVFIAPTEILAEQHHLAWSERLAAAGLDSHFLSGAVKGEPREAVYTAASASRPAVFFGTHALLSEKLRFENLGLVVIDEEQRFGVVQRDTILRKGEVSGIQPDMLILTATPIPRTLAMTLYGDLEISTLKERLPGRRPVETIHLRESERKRMMPVIRAALKRNERIYIVYPIIDESEDVALKDAKGQHVKIRKAFPEVKTALLTGLSKAAEKESVMRDFRDGRVSILVATSVVEVGLDVPDATVMVVEHAEHFGLSQLHQLRGRVGRASKPGTCILTTAESPGEYAEDRIRVCLECQDGFRIAEEDLRLRGPGEILGERQHGSTELRVASLSRDADLIPRAAELAKRIMDEDPSLERHLFLKRFMESTEPTGADLL